MHKFRRWIPSTGHSTRFLIVDKALTDFEDISPENIFHGVFVDIFNMLSMLSSSICNGVKYPRKCPDSHLFENSADTLIRVMGPSSSPDTCWQRGIIITLSEEFSDRGIGRRPFPVWFAKNNTLADATYATSDDSIDETICEIRNLRFLLDSWPPRDQSYIS